LPVILSLIEIVKIEIGIYDGMRPVNDYIEVSLPFLIVGLLFIFRQYCRLIFKEIQITCTDKDLQHALGKASMELKWRVEKNRNGVFRAYRIGENGPWWWGEMITIISDENTILINSISDPNQSPTPSSFGWDKKNVQTFIKHLETIVKENRV
jgi:hypothetical protein